MNEGFTLGIGTCGAEEALKAAAAMAMMRIIEKLHEENAREMTGRGKSETEGVKEVDETESRSREKLKKKTLKMLETAKDMADGGVVTCCLDEEEISMLIDAVSRLMPCQTEGVKKVDDTESRSPFHATVEGMLSADYREGFKAEYQQTKIRYEELKALNNRIEAEKITKKTGLPAHDCPDTILRAQQAAMGEYLHILEVRAEIENIKL